MFLLYLHLGKGTLHCLQFLYSHCQLFSGKIKENKMQVTSSHNHLAPWCCKVFLSPLPPHPLIDFSSVFSLSLSLPWCFWGCPLQTSWGPQLYSGAAWEYANPLPLSCPQIQHSRRLFFQVRSVYFLTGFYLHWDERKKLGVLQQML